MLQVLVVNVGFMPAYRLQRRMVELRRVVYQTSDWTVAYSWQAVFTEAFTSFHVVPSGPAAAECHQAVAL